MAYQYDDTALCEACYTYLEHMGGGYWVEISPEIPDSIDNQIGGIHDTLKKFRRTGGGIARARFDHWLDQD